MSPQRNMKRFSVRLPGWHMKRLIWWAEAKGQSVAGMFQNVVQARVEDNADQIDEMAADLATEQGLTVDEWKKRTLEKHNYEPRSGDNNEPVPSDDD